MIEESAKLVLLGDYT